MARKTAALLLGLVSFVIFMFIGETAGLLAAFATLAAYFCLSQFLLSFRQAEPHREWGLMLALVAIPLLEVAIVCMVEKGAVILTQGTGILVSSCAGTYLGALAASLVARRRVARP
jgi:hypothetical protein